MSGWTTASEVTEVLRRRWGTGRYLAAYAQGEAFVPFSLPVRRPTDIDLLERRDEVDRWLRRLLADCAPGPRRRGLRVELTRVPSRTVGHNELPRRVWVDGWDDLVGWLGTRSEVDTLHRLLETTGQRVPELVPWARGHPRVLLDNADDWARVLATIGWIQTRDQHLYLRQVDVPGVDTKFVERHKILLARLLDEVLPARRVDTRFTAVDFAARYRFRRRPDYTRIRSLGNPGCLPDGFTELTVRTDELDRLDPAASQVIIVENDVTFLALPDGADTVAIFGSGFALGSVAGLSWLSDRTVRYWGDLDTYGFAILNRLRSRYPDVVSVLMDAETLLAHPDQWVVEEKPTAITLPHLDESEAALYRDLVEDRYGHHVRLEQERIAYGRVLDALG